jgi:hypothetical protein
VIGFELCSEMYLCFSLLEDGSRMLVTSNQTAQCHSAEGTIVVF